MFEDIDDPVQCITPDWAVPASLKVYSSTRLGGVSKRPYNAMNLGLHVDDIERHVFENRERLMVATQCPGRPLWLNQVHGTDVYFVDQHYDWTEPFTADGSATRDKKRVLSVVTADCLPVVLSNADGNVVAVAHAGWRGLVSGVLQSAMRHFREDDQLHAWLGPAIGPTAFEVGAEVVDAFIARDQENAACFKPTGKEARDAEGKQMADLYQLARIELNRHRRVVVTGGEYCTYTDSDLFHSYRRDGARSGRMATLAWIE